MKKDLLGIKADFLGIELDTILIETRLLLEKKARMLNLIETTLKRDSITHYDL